MITEKKKPKDQIFLEELIGSKFPVSRKEKNMFCLVLEHKGEMVYVKEGYLEKI